MLQHSIEIHPLNVLRQLVLAILLICTTAMFSWDSFEKLDFLNKKEWAEKKTGFTEEETESPVEKQTEENNDLLTFHKELIGGNGLFFNYNPASRVLNGYHFPITISPVHYELVSPPPES